MAFELIKNENHQKFVIFIDSLSSLVAMEEGESKYPYILEILESYTEIVKSNS